jgi:hypothetical protein
MTFTNLVYYTGSNAISNIWAKTSDAWSLWTTFLTTTIVWNLLQTYSSILTDAINPFPKQILRIGNTAVDTNVEIATRNGRNVVLHLGDGPDATGDIDIGNGLGSTNTIQLLYATTGNGSSGVVNLGNSTSTLNLYSPMTPIRTYPVVPMTNTTGTFTYGTAGTIGYTLVNSNTYGSFFNGGGNTIIETIQSLSIPTGVWYLVGEVICNSTFGTLKGLSFGPTVPTGSGNPITTYPTGFFGGDFMVTFSAPAQNNSPIPLGGGGMTISAIYTNTTASPITVRLYFFRPGFGWTGGSKRGYFTATKIA